MLNFAIFFIFGHLVAADIGIIVGVYKVYNQKKKMANIFRKEIK